MLDVFVDSNWAGCKTTRRSTHCIVLMIGYCVLLCVARTQTLVSWSSAEAEFYRSVSGAAEALHFQKLLQFLRWELRIVVHSDSSGTIAIAQRLGVGSVKTIETKRCGFKRGYETSFVP